MNKSFLIAILFIISNIYAQNDTVNVYIADSISVSATRISQPLFKTPYAAEIIIVDKKRLSKKLVSTEEILSSMPGIFVNNRNNFALGDRISIRGVGSRSSFGIRGIKIILDDIPLTMADGQSQLNNLDLSSVGRIEVIKGPSSSLYGNSAGGVIEIKTQEVSPGESFFEPSISMGSYGFLRLQAKMAISNSKTSYFLNLNKFKIDGYRDHSATDNWMINAVSIHNINKNISTSAVLNFYYAPYSLNPSSQTKADAQNNPRASRAFIKNQGIGEKVQQVQGGITLSFNQPKNQLLKFTIYGLIRSLVNPIPSDIIELDRIAGGTRLTLFKKEKIGGIQFNLTSGVDTEIQFDQRDRYQNNGIAENLIEGIKRKDILDHIEYGENIQKQDESVIGLAPFIKMELTLNENLFYSISGRYDYYKYQVDDLFLSDNSDDSGSRNLNHFSPMTGLVYMPNRTTSYYVNYSSAFQTPTTTELGNQPSGKGGLNPNLDPEVINSYELGTKGLITSLKLRYQVALFIMMYDKMLIPFQISESGKEYFRNSGNSRNTGFELSFEWYPTLNFNASLGYSGMDFIFKEFAIDSLNFNGKDVPGVSPQKIYASIKYEKTNNYYAELQLNWVDQYFGNDNNGGLTASSVESDYRNDAYTILELSVGKILRFYEKDIHIGAAINNLLDTGYNGSIVPNAFGNRFFEPSPGRNWHIGIKVVF